MMNVEDMVHGIYYNFGYGGQKWCTLFDTLNGRFKKKKGDRCIYDYYYCLCLCKLIISVNDKMHVDNQLLILLEEEKNREKEVHSMRLEAHSQLQKNTFCTIQ